MKLTQFIVVASLFFLIGCWDSSRSPLIKNSSGQAVTLHLVFDERSENFVIEDNGSLLLPNLAKKERLKELRISSEGASSVVVTEDAIAKYLKGKNEVFLIQKGLTITPELKYK